MKRKWLWVFIILSGHTVSAQIKPFIVQPKKVEDIKLRTTDNKPFFVSLDKPVIFVFLSPECPLCKNYAPVLNTLQQKYPQVVWYGIFPGNGYSFAEINNYKKNYGIGFKLLVDPEKQLTNLVQATVTPEVIFINTNGAVLYSGLIDNWAVSLGKTRQVITKHYVADAINQFNGGKQITVKHTDPVGCLINDI